MLARPTLHILTAACLFVTLSPLIANSQGKFFAHTSHGRKTRMWIPPDVSTVRGILIVGNGAGGDSTTAASSRIYQGFGELHDFAVVGTGFWGNLSDPAEIGIWDNHLSELGSASGHPELVNAPWAPIGFSNGGQMSFGFNALRPEKVVAFITNKGCCYNSRLPGPASLATPGLLIAGELDSQFRRDSIRGLFQDNRPRGALWSWVEQECTDHTDPNDEIVLPFMAEAIRLRYPQGVLPSASQGIALNTVDEADGWLVDQSTWMDGLTDIASYSDFTGDKSTAGWLLNENMAQLYRAFATYDKPVSIVRPRRVTLGEFFGDEIPLALDVHIDTSTLTDWSKVELFNYASKVGEAFRVGDGQATAIIGATLAAGGVHALTALVTHADGVTLSPSNVVTVLTSNVPEPSSQLLLFALANLAGGYRGRRPK